MYVLSNTLERGNNNFDLLRLLAALAVMLGHSYGMQGGGFESMLLITHLESFGSLAVYAFFLISGMLVSASFAAHPRSGAFIVARVARILPGVFLCSVVIAFVVGPLFSSLPMRDYFTTPEVWRWFGSNAFLVGHVGGPLAGLFADHHAKFLVNPTAWTLPLELKCYVLVLLVGVLGIIRSRLGMFAFGIVASCIFAYFIAYPVDIDFFKDVFLLSPAYSFYPVPFFLLGMVLYGFRHSIVLSGKLVLVLSVGAAVLRYSRPGTAFFYLLFTYGLLWLSSTRVLRPLRPRHDYSYGIYLYGFVVQQIFSGFYPTMNSYVSLVFTVPVTVFLAAISWHLVERPVLRRANLWKDTAVMPPCALSASANS